MIFVIKDTRGGIQLMEQLWHVRMNYSLGGHRGSSVNFKYKKLIQVAIIRETIDCEILNL